MKKQLLGQRELLNRLTGQYEPASIYRGIDDTNLSDFDQNWLPVFRARVTDFSDAQAIAAGNAQDWHWDWARKAREASRSMGLETFAIECDGHTQGLMLVNLTQFARLAPHAGRELAYIELLATAPWNRKRTVPNPKYKGAGEALILTAISLSVNEGFEGRVGLHALAQSESWYPQNGFTDVEYDYVKKMRYFEMTAVQAKAKIDE